MSISIEYAYDRNGNLIRDDNKGMTFTYDLLGHPLAIAGSDNQTDYVYSADGRKLRATHTQGNNRILIGSNGQRDQYSHYYPYGGLMGDISTNDPHSYKYGGKELDRDFGIDLFDFEARQFDAKVSGFTSIDPLAEKYYGISPYAYCVGDPVNLVDPDGRFFIEPHLLGAIVGAGTEYVSQVAGNIMDNGLNVSSFTDVDVLDIVVAGVEGGATCGASVFKNSSIKIASSAIKNAIDIKTDGKVDVNDCADVVKGMVIDLTIDGGSSLTKVSPVKVEPKSRQVVRNETRVKAKSEGRVATSKEQHEAVQKARNDAKRESETRTTVKKSVYNLPYPLVNAALKKKDKEPEKEPKPKH